MFESNMLENMREMNSEKWVNTWRDLVTPQFKAFLDSLSTSSKEDTTEAEED